MTTEAHSPQQPVLVIMGVSGSGKSTVAGILAGQLGWDLEEGDDLHPPANVEKMAAGTPLTDDDRWPWLNRVGSGPRPIWCSWRTGYTSPPRRCWTGSSCRRGCCPEESARWRSGSAASSPRSSAASPAPRRWWTRGRGRCCPPPTALDGWPVTPVRSAAMTRRSPTGSTRSSATGSCWECRCRCQGGAAAPAPTMAAPGSLGAAPRYGRRHHRRDVLLYRWSLGAAAGRGRGGRELRQRIRAMVLRGARRTAALAVFSVRLIRDLPGCRRRTTTRSAAPGSVLNLASRSTVGSIGNVAQPAQPPPPAGARGGHGCCDRRLTQLLTAKVCAHDGVEFVQRNCG